MAEPRVMALTTAPVLDSDGFTALYGPGELHEVGSLPPGVAYRLVVADEAMVSQANPHAQQPKPEPAPEPVKTTAPRAAAKA